MYIFKNFSFFVLNSYMLLKIALMKSHFLKLMTVQIQGPNSFFFRNTRILEYNRRINKKTCYFHNDKSYKKCITLNYIT